MKLVISTSMYFATTTKISVRIRNSANRTYSTSSLTQRRVNEMQLDYDLFKTAQSFYEYAADIIEDVAVCIIYKYSDVRLTATPPQDIQEAIDAAWKKNNKQSQTKQGTDVSVLSPGSPISKMDADKSQPENPPATEAKQTTAGASTGLTQDFADINL